MEFIEFRKLFQAHVTKMLENQNNLFVVDVDKDELWAKYLDSFPEGTNPIYRERREHDCSCCKHFIHSFGNVVTINNDTVTSIWDFDTNDTTYQPVIDSLAGTVKASSIKDVFITKETKFGTDCNREQLEDKSVHTWHHFYLKLPWRFTTQATKTEASLTGEFRDIKNVFKRSLDEISKDAIDTILDLISQKSLYKGDEWQKPLAKFLTLHTEYHKLDEDKKDIYCWSTSVKVGGAIGKIRNHSIGVLLTDITQDVDVNDAVKKYEVIVAPTNYKRPKAVFTKKMIEQAQKTIADLGLLDSLGRRHAAIDDITINNVLFANKNAIKKMSGDVFTELQQEVTASPKQFKKIEEIPIDHFIEHILPRTTNIEIFLENKHSPNLMSLVAPINVDSERMFKWNNNFSWAYSGNIADSMKERVKAAGGKVDGILRFSLQWNEDSDNQNDFDAHCKEPNKNHIWYSNAGRVHPSSGVLDVDIIHPAKNQVAIENITWGHLNLMQEGIYHFWVHNYSHRGGRSGFRAEIEYDGQIYSYNYNKDIRNNSNVTVAEVKFTKNKPLEFIESLPSTEASRTIWNLQTNQFHPVSVCMFSPNYWDEQVGIGNRHYFFILNECENQDRVNGFFNEFLREEFAPHKRVFEALGGKMRVEQTKDQLSGLGFSSTKRNSLVCKLEGNVTRTIKIVF